MINIYISKADKSLPIDWDKMPENAQRHIIEYGLRQKLNDAGSSATTKELGKDEAGKQAFAMAEVVAAALMEGNVTIRQAASGLTLEERTFNKILKALYKKLFGRPCENEDTILADVAQKLGKPMDDIKAAIDKKVTIEVEIAKKIAALKAETVDIEL